MKGQGRREKRGSGVESSYNCQLITRLCSCYLLVSMIVYGCEGGEVRILRGTLFNGRLKDQSTGRRIKCQYYGYSHYLFIYLYYLH